MTCQPITSSDQVLESILHHGYAYGKPNPHAYHSMKAVLPNSISYSSLKKFADSPYAYSYSVTHPTKPTPSMRIGSLVDCLSMEPEAFTTMFRIVDKVAIPERIENLVNRLKNNLPCAFDTLRLAAKKDGTPYADHRQDPAQAAQWARQEAAGTPVFSKDEHGEALQLLLEENTGITRVSQAEFDKAELIAASARTALRDAGYSDYTPQVGMWVRTGQGLAGHKLATPFILTGLADLIDQDADRIIDMKTTSANITSEKALCWTIRDMNYDLQAGMYAILYEAITGRPLKKFTFFFVSTAEPYLCREVHLEIPELQSAMHRVLILLEDMDDHRATHGHETPLLEPVTFI